MNNLILFLSLFLVNCGRPVEGERIKPDRILPRTLVTNIRDQMRTKIKVLCYETNNNLKDSPHYMLRGNFYIGNIFKCDAEFNSCLGNGVYFHYFSGDLTCLAKRGFEEQFTLCLDEKNQNIVNHLVELSLSVEAKTIKLWCKEEILKVLLVSISLLDRDD